MEGEKQSHRGPSFGRQAFSDLETPGAVFCAGDDYVRVLKCETSGSRAPWHKWPVSQEHENTRGTLAS